MGHRFLFGILFSSCTLFNYGGTFADGYQPTAHRELIFLDVSSSMLLVLLCNLSSLLNTSTLSFHNAHLSLQNPDGP